jgi:hypothetical protein
MKDSKTTKYTQYTLPSYPTTSSLKHKRPKHHKTDITRAIGYIINAKGALVADPTYRGRKCLQNVNTPQTVTS